MIVIERGELVDDSDVVAVADCDSREGRPYLRVVDELLRQPHDDFRRQYHGPDGHDNNLA